VRCTLDVPLTYSGDWCMILHREAGEAKANGPYFSCERIKDPVDSTWHNTWCFRIARHIVCLARPCGMRLQRRGGLRELRGLPLQAFPATAPVLSKKRQTGQCVSPSPSGSLQQSVRLRDLPSLLQDAGGSTISLLSFTRRCRRHCADRVPVQVGPKHLR
jgi:hypothetical protein